MMAATFTTKAVVSIWALLSIVSAALGEAAPDLPTFAAARSEAKSRFMYAWISEQWLGGPVNVFALHGDTSDELVMAGCSNDLSNLIDQSDLYDRLLLETFTNFEQSVVPAIVPTSWIKPASIVVPAGPLALLGAIGASRW